jgi:hypothetical protein
VKIDGGLRQIFRSKLPSVHWQSIESRSTGKGTPDSNGCLSGVEFWVEFKKTDSNKVKSLKPEQVAWCERRTRAGGKVFFAVRQTLKPLGRTSFDRDILWLIRGSGARSLYSGGLASLSPSEVAGRWPGGPRAWDWAAIRDLLAQIP